MWSPPRPCSPATPRRIVSLAPSTRPDDLVPAMVTVAAAARVRRRNWRRLKRDIRSPEHLGQGRWGKTDTVGYKPRRGRRQAGNRPGPSRPGLLRQGLGLPTEELELQPLDPEQRQPDRRVGQRPFVGLVEPLPGLRQPAPRLVAVSELPVRHGQEE